MEQLTNYKDEYKEFILEYKNGIILGDKVGEVIARLAAYYTEANALYASALIAYNRVAAKIEESEDDNGKAISSSKAKVMSSATDEYADLARSKADVESIETCINALKSLQKGILQEWNYTGAN